MKYLIAFVAALVTLTPNVSSAHDWHQPMRHIPERGHGWNPWPFVAGAVVGGIIVREYNREPTVITSRQPEPPVQPNCALGPAAAAGIRPRGRHPHPFDQRGATRTGQFPALPATRKSNRRRHATPGPGAL